MTEFSFNPDISFESELAGVEAAGGLASRISGARENDGDEPLTDEQRQWLLDQFAPGYAHFLELATEAGRMAGEGDPLGALSLMGGEEKARELVGDEEVDMLLAEIDQKF